MADQVAILRGGVIAQINTPSSLYRLPGNAELAQFLGEATWSRARPAGRWCTPPWASWRWRRRPPPGPAGRRGAPAR